MREVTYWVLPTSRTSQEAAPGARVSLQGVPQRGTTQRSCSSFIGLVDLYL